MTLRKRISESMMSLPIAAVISVIVWVAGDIEEWTHWAGWAVTAVTTYLVMELNNYFQLLRIRSRLMSTTYLMLATAMAGMHSFGTEMLVPLSVLGGVFLLFTTYQQAQCEGRTFYAFVALGVGSMVFVPILTLTLPLWYAMGAYLRTLSLRTMMASLLGLICPYWLLLAAGTVDARAWYWVTEQIPAACGTYFSAQSFAPYYVEPRVFVETHLASLVSLALITLLTCWATLHYQRTDYLDKIRTRMYLHTLRLLQVFFAAFVVLWPAYFGTTLRLLVVTTAVFASHYFALAKGRWADLSFIGWMLAFAALYVFNSY